MSENRTKVRLLQKQVWRKGLVSMRVTKPEGFTFTPGQFVRLGLDIEADGKQNTPPEATLWLPFLQILPRVFIVEVPNGLVSPRLCALEAGSELWLETNLWGSLLPDRLSASQNLWCLSTGTGLAPFLSILRQDSVWKNGPRSFWSIPCVWLKISLTLSCFRKLRTILRSAAATEEIWSIFPWSREKPLNFCPEEFLI